MKTENRSTRDIYLAAAWMALGAKFVKADRADPKHQIFHFKMERPEDELGQAITTGLSLTVIEADWLNADLMINAIKFKEAIQRMKGIIYTKD